jgi:uncharacterized membrane protein
MIGLGQSVWFDEAYSVMIAKQPVLDLIHLTSVDTHPPLYYLLLKAWAGVFGWSELALRSLSVVAMGGAIVFGGLLAKRMFGVRAALISLPFIALSPLLLRYGFEIRMYALASLIGIAATFVLVSAIEMKEKPRQWRLYALYALLVALGMYALYYTVLLWITHFAWLVWRSYRDRKPIVKTPWFIALLGSATLFLPWLPVFVSQVGNGALASTSQPVDVNSLVGVMSFSFLYQPAWQLGGYGTIIVVFVLLTLGMLTVRAFRAASKKERDYLWLIALYLLLPIVLIAVMSLAKPMYTERYISHIAIGAMLFVGVIVAYGIKKATPRMWFAIAILYVVLLLGVGQLAKVGNFSYQRLLKPSVKEAAASIKDCGRDKTIFAADPYTAVELSYYLPSCEVRFYSDSDVLKGGYTALSNSPLHIAHPTSQLANSIKLYYVYYGESKLTMPYNLVQVSHDNFSALTVDAYVTE